MLHVSRRHALALAATLSAGGVLSACSTGPTGSATSTSAASSASADAGAFPVTLTHAYGTTKIDKAATKIVTVGWSDHDSVAALGVVPAAAPKVTWGGNKGMSTDYFDAQLKEIAHADGALLIVDEVMTGFRVGYQGWFGKDQVAGDLTTFGKVVSGGLPAAAFGGRADIMDHLAPAGSVYQAGTLSGNPVAVASGLTSLRLATEQTYETLDKNAERVSGLISDALSAESVAHHVQRAGNMFSFRFAEGEGKNFEDMQAADTYRFPAFFHALLDHGVFAPPSVYETWFVSTALTDADFETIEKAAKVAAQAAARAEA